MAHNGKPKKAIELYIGDGYVKHSPFCGGGNDAFIAHYKRMAPEFPEKEKEFVNAIEAGNLVSLHTRQNMA